jgi:hypothetical protein
LVFSTDPNFWKICIKTTCFMTQQCVVLSQCHVIACDWYILCLYWNTLVEDIFTAPSLETFKEVINHMYDYTLHAHREWHSWNRLCSIRTFRLRFS